MLIISFILLLMAAYLLSGLCFAIPFIIRGVDKIDEGAKGAGWGFRLIILPGTVVFWPFLLRKWLNVLKMSRENKAPW